MAPGANTQMTCVGMRHKAWEWIVHFPFSCVSFVGSSTAAAHGFEEKWEKDIQFKVGVLKGFKHQSPIEEGSLSHPPAPPLLQVNQNPSHSNPLSTELTMSSPDLQVVPDPQPSDLPPSDVGTVEARTPQPGSGSAEAHRAEGDDEEGDEEEEEGECGFCLFMKGGGCRDAFIEWENCIEEAEKSKEDIVEKCFQATSALKKCMEAHLDYYEPILRAEKAANEEAVRELEKEAAAMDSELQGKSEERVVVLEVPSEQSQGNPGRVSA